MGKGIGKEMVGVEMKLVDFRARVCHRFKASAFLVAHVLIANQRLSPI